MALHRSYLASPRRKSEIPALAGMNEVRPARDLHSNRLIHHAPQPSLLSQPAEVRIRPKGRGSRDLQPETRSRSFIYREFSEPAWTCTNRIKLDSTLPYVAPSAATGHDLWYKIAGPLGRVFACHTQDCEGRELTIGAKLLSFKQRVTRTRNANAGATTRTEQLSRPRD